MILSKSLIAPGLLLVLSLLVAGCGPFSSLAGSRAAAQEGIAFSLTPEKTDLLLGEPLRLRMELTNSSPSEITGVFNLSPRAGLLQILAGPSGGPLQPYLPPSAQVAQVNAPLDSTSLAPGASVESMLTVSFDTTANDWLFPSTGSYQVRASLHTDPTNVERVLTSNTVAVNVIQPSGPDLGALDFIRTNNLKPFLTSDARISSELEESLPKLLELLDRFPNSTYQPYVMDALNPLATRFPDLLLVPPVVELHPDTLAGPAPLKVEFTVDAHKPHGSIVEYLWDFNGDGAVDETTTEPTITRIFAEEGTFPVSVMAIDNTNLGILDSRIIATKPGFHLGLEPLDFTLETG